MAVNADLAVLAVAAGVSAIRGQDALVVMAALRDALVADLRAVARRVADELGLAALVVVRVAVLAEALDAGARRLVRSVGALPATVSDEGARAAHSNVGAATAREAWTVRGQTASPAYESEGDESEAAHGELRWSEGERPGRYEMRINLDLRRNVAKTALIECGRISTSPRGSPMDRRPGRHTVNRNAS